jgi:hypothetical protein
MRWGPVPHQPHCKSLAHPGAKVEVVFGWHTCHRKGPLICGNDLSCPLLRSGAWSGDCRGNRQPPVPTSYGPSESQERPSEFGWFSPCVFSDPQVTLPGEHFLPPSYFSEPDLCSFFLTSLRHLGDQGMVDELCDFSGTANEWNILIFTFQTGTI